MQINKFRWSITIKFHYMLHPVWRSPVAMMMVSCNKIKYNNNWRRIIVTGINKKEPPKQQVEGQILQQLFRSNYIYRRHPVCRKGRPNRPKKFYGNYTGMPARDEFKDVLMWNGLESSVTLWLFNSPKLSTLAFFSRLAEFQSGSGSDGNYPSAQLMHNKL